MSAVHQFVPMLHRGDAVGRHTIRLHEVLASRGVRSEIYVELTDDETADETRPFEQYANDAQAGDVLVYQFATASGLAPWLQNRAETLVLNYHNVTPPEHYAPWNNAMARHQLRAQQELRALAPRCALGLAVSSFNEAELREAGFARTAVVPPAALVTATAPPAAAGSVPPSTESKSGTPPGGGRWLSVGRVAPNKGIELAVMALLITRAHDDPRATLAVVGRPVVPAYTAALHRFVDEMGLHDAVRFTGGLSDADLVTTMAQSDVFVLTSRHEGFGVPVIEAMSLGLPVVANRAGALPEVVGEAGLLVDAADPWAVADAVARLRGDGELRASLTAAGLRRVADLDLPSAADRAADVLLALAR